MFWQEICCSIASILFFYFFSSFLCFAIYGGYADDGEVFAREGSSIDEEPIDVWHLRQSLAVGNIGGAAIDDASGGNDHGVDVLVDPATNGNVDVLYLFEGSNFPYANGPHKLIDDD